MTRQSTSDLVENQTRLFQTTMSEIAKSIRNISDHQQKLKENFQLLQTQANKNSMTVNTLMVKTTLLKQSIILESLLNQYAYKTQNLISIINSAIHGKIHSTVLPPIKLIKELKAIQLTLPAGTQLSVEPKIQNVAEFFSISSVSILQKDFLLVFALHFPIITVNSYDMYHPIPLPFFMKEDNAVIIESEIDYISFSDDSEFYFTLSQQQSDSCTRLTPITIYKGNEPIQRRASSKICEVEILKNPQFLPISFALGASAAVRGLIKYEDVEVLDLGCATMEIELETCIRKALGSTEDDQSIKVKNIGQSFRGVHRAIVKLKSADAIALTNQGRIKVGWMSARVRLKTKTTKCYK
ncbi:hypothetical protein QTP88_015040 [Uroleucon formosanum]